jgi:cell division protein FtsI (penicillin-binding protein 3)
MSRVRPWHGVVAPAPPTQYRRLAVITTLVLAGFGVMIAQLVNLHVFKGPELRREAERILVSTEYYTPPRGEIRDRNGEVLARSELVKEVKADPSLVGPQHARFLAEYLAGPLEMDLEDLVERLSNHTRLDAEDNPVPRQYVLLKRGVSQDRWAMVRSNLATLRSTNHYPALRVDGAEVRGRRAKEALFRDFRKAIQVEPFDRQIRHYPRGRFASQLLGFVGYNAGADPSSAYTSAGIEGLELWMNPVLEGVGGSRTTRAIRRGGMPGLAQDRGGFRPRPGQHVVLTLDARLQGMVEDALTAAWTAYAPAGLSAVVVDPRTGEILAMANRPDFDPNDVRASRDFERRNRAISDACAPGSTAKVMTYGVGLDQKVIDLEQWIDGHYGSFRYRKASVQEPDRVRLGVVPLRTALAKSSNIAASKIAIDLTAPRLHDGFARFGIGQRTGIGLPAESSGRLWPWSTWDTNGWALTRISFGYQFTATPLQMTMAVAAVANEGRLMRPFLVKQIEDDQGQVWTPFVPTVRAQALSPQAARDLSWGLRSVVEEGGTGGRAALPNHAVAGKTGTAEKWIEEQKRWGDYTFASFIGFFPAEDPVLCIGVFVDEPRRGGRGGGTVAAPVFREIASRAAEYLGIPPSPLQVRPGQNLAQETGVGPLTRPPGRSRM